MEPPIPSPSATALEREIFAQIPLAAAMQARVAEYGPERLVLAAPFEINRNHEGSAFGGAIECLATLAGWGFVWLCLGDPAATIMISRVETRFRVPLVGELRATAIAPQAAHWTRFAQTLTRRGRAGIDILVRVGCDKTPDAAQFRGRYVVIRSKRGHRPIMESPFHLTKTSGRLKLDGGFSGGKA